MVNLLQCLMTKIKQKKEAVRLQLFARPERSSLCEFILLVDYDACWSLSIYTQLMWIGVKVWVQQVRFKAAPFCDTEQASCNQYLTIKKKSCWEQLGRLRYCFGQIGLIGTPMRAQFTDKRFGEAEEESHTVNWVESEPETVSYSHCGAELSL